MKTTKKIWVALLLVLPSLLAAEWKLDTGASHIKFTAGSLFGSVDGEFKSFTLAGFDAKQGTGTLKINVQSIFTDNSSRDDHLRNEDFFHTEKYPTALAELVSWQDGKARIKLTIRGVSEIYDIPMAKKSSDSAFTYSGKLKLNRKIFGINYDPFYSPIDDIVELKFKIKVTD